MDDHIDESETDNVVELHTSSSTQIDPVLEVMLNAMAVFGKYQSLIETHLSPRVSHLPCGPSDALSHLKKIKSFEAFQLFVMLWQKQIVLDRAEADAVVTRQPFVRLNRNKLGMALLRQNKHADPIRDHQKYIQRARRIVVAGIAFDLIEEIEKQVDAGEKPLEATSVLCALLNTVGESSLEYKPGISIAGVSDLAKDLGGE